MLERQEIDALLISSLYGELTPTEETRLATHLEAHPADKLALAALSSTREAVRESRILQVQLDPPQQVSALLLQEAARRAPKAEFEGWFAGLARSFMAHRAMAAAAMLVVVIGVTTLVKNRKGDAFVESSAPVASQTVGAGSAAGSAIEQGTLAPSATATLPREKDEAKLDGKSAGQPASKGDSFRVDLEEAGAKGGTAGEDRKQPDAEAKGRRERALDRSPVAKPDAAERAVAGDETTGKAKTAKKAAPATKSPSGSYLELRSDEPAPKDFESTPTDGRGYKYEDDLAKTPPTGSTATVKASPRSDPKSEAQQVTQSPPTTTSAPGGGAPPRAPTSAPAASSPPPPAKVAGTTRDAARAPAEDKAANDPQLAWAREQHTAITAKVRAGDCKTAANIAVGLANRDPSYYQQNVATDRTVRDCLAYIDNAREKDAEQRAERARANQKRSNEPAKRAVDRPTKPTPTDSTR